MSAPQIMSVLGIRLQYYTSIIKKNISKYFLILIDE